MVNFIRESKTRIISDEGWKIEFVNSQGILFTDEVTAVRFDFDWAILPVGYIVYMGTARQRDIKGERLALPTSEEMVIGEKIRSALRFIGYEPDIVASNAPSIWT